MKKLFALSALCLTLPTLSNPLPSLAEADVTSSLTSDSPLIAFFLSLSDYNCTMKIMTPLGELGTAYFYGPKASFFHYDSAFKLSDAAYSDYGYLQREEGVFSYLYHRNAIELQGCYSASSPAVLGEDVLYESDFVVDPSEFILSSLSLWKQNEDGTYETTSAHNYAEQLGCYLMKIGDNYTDFDGLKATLSEDQKTLTISTISDVYAAYSLIISDVGTTTNPVVTDYLQNPSPLADPTDWNQKTKNFFATYFTSEEEVPFLEGCFTYGISYTYHYDEITGGVIQITDVKSGDTIDKAKAFLETKGYVLNESESRLAEDDTNKLPRALCLDKPFSLANGKQKNSRIFLTYNPVAFDQGDDAKKLRPQGAMVVTIYETSLTK